MMIQEEAEDQNGILQLHRPLEKEDTILQIEVTFTFLKF